MTSEGSPLIYLDHNATTPVAPEAAEAMAPYLGAEFGNPSSDHALGRRARQAVEEARASLAALIGAAPEEVVFTSGGTESNNLAIRGVAAQTPAARRRIVTSTVEHPATTAPLALLEASGWTLTRVPVTASGILDLDAGLAALGDDVALVTVMLAQNETGALMPVAALAAAARTHGALVHTDAAQAIAKIPVSVDDLGVDLCSIAAHKCYGPKGVGALYIRRGTPLSPLVVGAGQEAGLRPGTENVAGIVGLGAAARLATDHLTTDAARIAQLRDELWTALSAKVPGIGRHTPDGASLPNTLLVSFPAVLGAEILARVPQLAASTGSACHAGEHTPNATLLAMGVAPDVALGAIRLSLGRGTTRGQIEEAADLLAGAHRSLVATTPPPTYLSPHEQRNAAMKILVVLNDPPYGTERSYNGLRLAEALSKRDGVEVRVFCFGDAVGCAIANQKVPDGYYHLDRMVSVVVRHGGEIGCCGTCMDARGLAEELLVDGARRSTLEEATEWAIWADKVVSF